RRTHQADGSAERYKEAKLVTGYTVAGGQLGLLAPIRPAAHEHIGRPGMGVERRPNQGGVTAKGHGEAKLVTGYAVAGGQLGLLAPIRPAAHEHIGRPGMSVERRSRSNQRRVPVEGYCGT